MLKLTLKMLQCTVLGSLLFMGACSVEGVATIPTEPGGEVVRVLPCQGVFELAGNGAGTARTTGTTGMGAIGRKHTIAHGNGATGSKAAMKIHGSAGNGSKWAIN